jgi:arylsulfatase A-like enzyme
MTTERINLLLITADQLRADCLSAAGHPLVRTPRLDALAEAGVTFARHYGQCLPCGPARTSLLTGMYAMNHRSVRNGTPLDAAFTNLALEARKAGYEPWLIGYTDTTMDPRRFHPNDPRVRRYEEILPGMLQYAPGSEGGSDDSDWRRHLRALGYDIGDQPHRQRAPYPDAERRGPTYAPTHVKAEHSDTAYTTDRALRFVDQHRDAPWLLHLSYLRPHPPFVAPEPYHDLYRPEDVPDFACLPSLEAERALHPFHDFRLDRLEMDPPLPPAERPNDSLPWRQARATYYGLISELDHQVGRLLDGLEASGLLERTLVIFTSDHAEQLGDHFAWGKQTPFDRSAHVPLTIRLPAGREVPRGRTVRHFTEHVDLLPTILDYLGVPKPLQCDGHSLRPFLEGGTPAGWRSEAHWEYDFGSIADDAAERLLGLKLEQCCLAVIRDEAYKYVHFAGLPPLLFDVRKDPGELMNLAPDPAYAPVRLDYAGRMLSWRMTYNRRELTGWSLHSGRMLEAERERRIA